MKIGDTVRVIEIPADLPDPDNELGTRRVFERCLGRVFPIVDFDEYGFVELHVGEVVGQESFMQSIWIEPEFVEIVTP